MTDIKEMLYELGYSNISEYPREYRTRPIYRESDNNTVLRVDKATGRFVDFAENISGSFEDLVKLTLKMKTVNEAQKWVSSKGDVSEERKVVVVKPEIKSPKIFDKNCLSKLVNNHIYWQNRGISEDTISQFKGGIISEGKMKNRYVFPIFDAKDRLVGVSGRYTKKIEYDNIPKWKHIGDKYAWKYPLFLNHEIVLEKKEVFLVESIGDMLSLWEAGYKNSIVTFGLDISSSIMGVLLRFDLSKIYISFNNDSNKNSRGNLASKKVKQKLLNHFDPNQVEVKLPTKNDFGDMNTKEIQVWVKQNTSQHHG